MCLCDKKMLIILCRYNPFSKTGCSASLRISQPLWGRGHASLGQQCRMMALNWAFWNDIAVTVVMFWVLFIHELHGMARLHLTNLPETPLNLKISFCVTGATLAVGCLSPLAAALHCANEAETPWHHSSFWMGFLWWCQSLCQAVKCTVCDNGVRNQQNPNALSVPALSAALFVGVGHSEAGVCWWSQVWLFLRSLLGVMKRVGINFHTRVKATGPACALLCLQ